MASVSDAVYPLRTYPEIITTLLTTTNLVATSITGSTNVSGSAIQVKGVIFNGSTGSSGSTAIAASIGLLVSVTGSTYILKLYTP